MKLYQVENFLIVFFQVAIAALVLGIVAHFAVQAWIVEDDARVQRLEQHFYQIALARSPAAPTGVRPNFGDLSEPKTRVFQDSGRESTSGMGFDARKKERGK